MSKILRIKMRHLTIQEETAKESYELLGGRAFIAKFLLDEVPATCQPLGRHNKLILAPGLLGGSKVFSSGRVSIGAKSPLTGGVKESNGGGIVGSKLGRLAYKAIVIEEIPMGEQKYILRVTAEGAELLPGDSYWGLGVYETAERLHEVFGRNIAIACIGPAGERKFSAAGIANTDIDGVPSRYCGRGGLGAVMGSKGIKAIIIDDSQAKVLEPARPEEFKSVVLEFARLLNESPVAQTYRNYGTAALVNLTNSQGGLPTRNFTTGVFEGAEKICGERMRDIIEARKGKMAHACMPGCIIRCSNNYVNEQGESLVAPLEYETIALMGSNLDIDDLDTVAQLNYLCNDYGLDTIETGAALGVAMASGLLEFGDKQGALDLVKEIGKGSIIGRVLGMGAETTGKVLGVVHIPVVKGQAMPGYEPRAFKGLGVTYATSTMGPDHTAGQTLRAKIDHSSREGQATLSKKAQNTLPVYDNLGLCLFTSAGLGAHPEVLVALINSQLGMDYRAEDVFSLAEQTVKWEREFNQKAGFTQVDDRLPESFNEIQNPAVKTTFDVSGEELDQVHA